MARVLFSGARLTPQQLQNILWQPRIASWDLTKARHLIYGESDSAHPKRFVTPQLIEIAPFKKLKKDATAQAKKAIKEGSTTLPELEFALGVVNDVLFRKMLALIAALVDRAAAEDDWIVVDRVRARAPAAEVCGRTASRAVARRIRPAGHVACHDDGRITPGSQQALGSPRPAALSRMITLGLRACSFFSSVRSSRRRHGP